MDVNGIWKVEMLGPYGWEPVSTAFLQDGDYKAGSQDHYAVGRYELDEDRIQITATSHVHGQVRTLFGDKRTEIDLQFEGRVDGDRISGQARDEKSSYTITFRADRIGDIS